MVGGDDGRGVQADGLKAVVGRGLGAGDAGLGLLVERVALLDRLGQAAWVGIVVDLARAADGDKVGEDAREEGGGNLK